MAEAKNDAKKGFTIVWTIQNFSQYVQMKAGSSRFLLQNIISCPPFTVEALGKSTWCIMMKVKENRLDIPFALCRVKKNCGTTQRIDIEFELSFIGIDGTLLLKEKGRMDFEMRSVFEFKSLITKDEILVDRRDEFLPNDTLTVRLRMWRSDDEVQKTALCFAWTELREENEHFFWEVDKFSSLQVGQKISIDVRPKLQVLPQLTMSIFLTHKGDDLRIEVTTESSKMVIPTMWKVSLMDIVGKEVDFTECVFVMGRKKVCLFPRLTTKNKLMADEEMCLPNDVLLLRCHCTTLYVSEIEYNSQSSENVEAASNRLSTVGNNENTEISPTPLMKDLRAMFEDGSLSDVNLRVGTEVFPAHKILLGARSSVFKAMFTSDTKEKDIELDGLDADTVRMMLKYIYTDVMEDLNWDKAIRLGFVSDKYGLLTLKKTCLAFLKANLCILNVCEALVLADRCHDDNLKETVLNFFVSHDDEIIQSDEWKSFKTNNESLAFRTLEYMYMKVLERKK